MSKANKKRKISIAGLVFLVLFAAITVLGLVYYEEIYSEEGFFQSHPTGIAIVDAILSFAPHILGSFQVLFIALLVLYIIKLIFSKVFKGKPRRVTVGKLVSSIVKVVIWVVAIIAILAVWGVNVGALVAGAGVLTLIVGFGMQSLIADVIAGIFLVCDGTIEVGEIITIDDWRGTVQEIGIRNTKLINYSGDIRVCNNSTITVYINQSREKSYPTVIVGIAYEEDVVKVEKLFIEHKQELKARLPRILEGPDYLGVDNLAGSSVDLKFGARCKEEDFFQVQRDMRGVIKTFLNEMGVNIPFPQVVVHTSED